MMRNSLVVIDRGSQRYHGYRRLVDLYVIVRGSPWYRGYRAVDICGVMRESREKVKLLVVMNDYYDIVNTKLDWKLR